METGELKERIAAFPRWHYRFEFDGGVSTPMPDPGMVNRHEQRRRYFFAALLRLMGGSLQGRRVLDLGCNAGFWSLEAVEAQADFVLGLDARQDYIEQASLVFEAKGIDPRGYRFEVGDLFEHPIEESFDIVLCLGLLNVVAKPVELFELMAGVGAETIVIDTGLSRVPSAFFELSRLLEPRNAVGSDIVLIPTRDAVVELAGRFGYNTVALALNITDYTSMDDYRDDRRLAFICSKGGSVSTLAAEPPMPPNAWLAAAARTARRVRRSR